MSKISHSDAFNQKMKKIVMTTNVLVVIGFIIYSASRNEIVPNDYLEFSYLPVGINMVLFVYALIISSNIKSEVPKYQNKTLLNLVANFLVNTTLIILILAQA
ncbi:hypothetical protein BFP97_12660 [Roseivirga sp. 4D4]|uniref:hypothetical protein n=1 Tax=Roseivirga sp. 4D4 TaxID=1889784 RepID=UPI0008531EC2|nr:hypothetical protein [Roseivirga sp. 4D4]OEK02317.1 hypothetical protein BFP97_12660 [Roseivirga sp. 4D4]